MKFDDDPNANLWFKTQLLFCIVGIPMGILCSIAAIKFIFLGGTVTNYNTYTHTTENKTEIRIDCRFNVTAPWSKDQKCRADGTDVSDTQGE